MKFSRRKFLMLAPVAVLGTTVAAASTYLYLNDESQQLTVEQIQIPIKNLKPGLEGFTIALLADFHLYPLTQLDLIRRAVTMTNDLKPDLTVLLGDYVWHEEEAIFDLAPVLAGLDAKHGVFAAIGNHDIWTNVELIKRAFNEVRLPYMINEGLPLTAGNSTLYLAALDDGWSGQPDLNAALDNRPGDAPVVLLYHEPDLADETSLDGRVALQLSGHSHGGQIRLPRKGALILPYLSWKYDMGLYNVNGMWLYTNRGIGVTNEPVRYNCPPEITLITLVSG
jgi:predicted MPP superfamily phosphohydrolase